jgi:restriction system protein
MRRRCWGSREESGKEIRENLFVVDITYHYPPELFQLLVDAIPRLFRAKNDVLLFFRGAGVERRIYQDLEQQLLLDRNSVNKFEITRKILSRLNEAGESSLRERREVLKRVVEFDDFSTCWPNDQLEAKGLVAQIQKVTNRKDSFTRMKQEREAELSKHRAEKEREAEVRQRKREDFELVKQDFYRLFGSVDSHQRGKLLEGVLNRLFGVSGVLVREAFVRVDTPGEGVVEQIDGVIELDGEIYLVEMKWHKDPIGVGEVSPHLVRVFSRGASRGVFISYTGYTPGAITTCKESLSKMVIVLCTLDEFVEIFEREHDVKEILRAKVRASVVDKEPYKKVVL